MKIFLILIPFITTAFGMLLYKFQDRKFEIFRIDLVQFVYLFLVAPTLYVWLKSFLFYIVRNELFFVLTPTEMFVIDTVFSVIAFIVMAAIAMHSLTKTFWLKRHFDPHFDIYHLSEYFHLWWTHIVICAGAMALTTFISVTNVFFPLVMLGTSKLQFYSLLTFGLLSGVAVFLILALMNPKQGNFMRVMKLFLAFFLFIHVILYFIFDPTFNMPNVGYWFVFSMFLSAVFVASTFEGKQKTNKIVDFLTHIGWGDNKGLDIFAYKKRK